MNDRLKSDTAWFLPDEVAKTIPLWERTTDGRNLREALTAVHFAVIDPASASGDCAGIALCSVSHPTGVVTVHQVLTPLRLSPESVERVEIEMRLMPGPEIAYARTAEVNDDFTALAASQLAWLRQEARTTQKMQRRARYMRRQRRDRH